MESPFVAILIFQKKREFIHIKGCFRVGKTKNPAKNIRQSGEKSRGFYSRFTTDSRKICSIRSSFTKAG